MSINLAESIIGNHGLDQEVLAQSFANSYHWSRGYGPSAAKLLKGIKRGQDWRELNRKKFKDGSMGNGAAMRAPIVALYHPNIDESLLRNVAMSAEITHAHHDAITGALIIAQATVLALKDKATTDVIMHLENSFQSESFDAKLKICADFCNLDSFIGIHEIKKHLGNGILASTSCFTALYFALKYRDLDVCAMLNSIFELGGDADTIAAMAGAIWGAFNGADCLLDLGQQVEDFEHIQELSAQLHHNYTQNNESQNTEQ